jgi:hypothetical protein
MNLVGNLLGLGRVTNLCQCQRRCRANVQPR